MHPAVPPLKLALLHGSDLPPTSATSPRSPAPSCSGSAQIGLQTQLSGEPRSARGVSDGGVHSARARRSSTGVLVNSVSAASPLGGPCTSRRPSNCEMLVEQRKAASQVKDLDPTEVLDRVSLWGEAGSAFPRASTCIGMQTVNPRLATEPAPMVVGAVGTQVAVLRAQALAQTQAQVQDQDPASPAPAEVPEIVTQTLQRQQNPSHSYTSPRPSGDSYSSYRQAYQQPRRSSFSCAGAPGQRASSFSGVAEPASPLSAPLNLHPTPCVPTPPTDAQIKARAVAAPVRRSYLKQLMDSMLGSPKTKPSISAPGDPALQGSAGSETRAAQPGTAGAGAGAQRAHVKSWHELPAEVQDFLRFHNGGKKAFHERMAAEAKQALARRYQRCSDAPEATVAEWLSAGTSHADQADATTGAAASFTPPTPASPRLKAVATRAPAGASLSPRPSLIITGSPLSPRSSCDSAPVAPPRSSSALRPTPQPATQAAPPAPKLPPNASQLERASADALHLLQTALSPPQAKGEHQGVDPTRRWRFNTKGVKGQADSPYMYVSKQTANSKIRGQ